LLYERILLLQRWIRADARNKSAFIKNIAVDYVWQTIRLQRILFVCH